jgi:FkbM family methyltransferase
MATNGNRFCELELTKAVRALFAEGVAGASERERAAFDYSAAPSGEIVLFGAGGLGRRTLSGLRKVGFEPLAFSDNNSRLWNTSIDGITVLSPEVAARRYGTRATFVITTWSALGTDRMAEREEQLRGLGCERVVPFPPLFWKYPDALLPHYTVDVPHKVHEQADQVLAACSLWADDASRREYLAQLRFRLYGEFNCLPGPVQHTIYFPTDLWHPIDNEVFVDCGAYDGDTITSLLEQPQARPPSIFSFEPDPDNFAKLTATVAGLPQRGSIVLQQAAVGTRAGTVTFAASAGAASCVGMGELGVKCVALDEALCDAEPTYIKMDIEGSELQALAGAEKLIRRHAPLLAISAYHRQDDLWRIPLFIRSLNRQYRLFLRPHRIEGWDLVCYAVPENRMVEDSANA